MGGTSAAKFAAEIKSGIAWQVVSYVEPRDSFIVKEMVGRDEGVMVVERTDMQPPLTVRGSFTRTSKHGSQL